MRSTVSLSLQHSENNFELLSFERLHILRLRGTPQERAQCHGELVQSRLSPALLEYFIKQTMGMRRAALHPVRSVIKALMRAKMSSIPPALREEVEVYAQSLGLGRTELISALLAPDLASWAFSFLKNPWISSVRPLLGCSTIAGQTLDDGYIIARNLDFPGIGFFDHHPCVTVHLPTQKGELARVGIGSDGVHFASISGINEAGIGLVVHQNFSRAASSRGMPLLLVGDWVLRQAQSLSQAVALLERHRTGPLWTFVLFDLLQGKTIAVENSRQVFEVRETNGPFCQTNHCHTSAGKKVEFNQISTHQNSLLRYQLGLQTAQSLADLDYDQAIHRARGFLANGCNPPEISVFADVIKPETIQSILWSRPRKGTLTGATLWVSIDGAPTASGRYLGLPIEGLFSALSGKSEWQKNIKILSTLEEKESQRRGQEALAKACSLSDDNGNHHEALQALDGLTGPGIELIRAILNFNLTDFQKAALSAQRGLEYEIPQHIKESLRWVLCLSKYSMGKFIEARQCAQLLTQSGNPYYQKNSQRYLRSGKISKIRRTLIFDWFAGDLWSPPVQVQI